jgi:hypothetical protein
MNVLELCHFRSPSVVIHNLHIESVTTLPDKTDPPLIVDTDAVLSGTVSGVDDLHGIMFCNAHEVPVVVQQPTTMFQCCGSNDAIVGLANGYALFAQLAINISGSNEDSFGHWQHNQGAKIAPDPPVDGVIGNALENFCQYDATQGEVFIIEDELLQCNHVRQISIREEVDPDAGVNQNH